MRILVAFVSFLAAAVFLGYFGLLAFSFGHFVYAMYPFNLSDITVTDEIYAFLGLTGGSLLLGVLFLAAGLSALKGKPRRQQ